MRSISGIADLAERARRRLPAFAWSYLEGGSGEEKGVARNRARLDAVQLVPRYCRGGIADAGCTLFGQGYDLPFGIAPVGMGGLMWPGSDLALARAAKANRIPMVNSTVSSTSLEAIAETAGDMAWFQLYVARRPDINQDLLARAWAAGIRVLAVTVDVPLAGDRRRDVRNRMVLPFRPGPRFLWEVASRPAWAMATLRHGSPGFPNLAPYVGDVRSQTLSEFVTTQIKRELDWTDIRDIRRLWPGTLLLKGIQDPGDARTALDLGADGLWVSNHGGRQLEAAPASIDSLAVLRRALGERVPLILDSGIRSGEDMARARALGADFVFSGRSFYYGAGGGGGAKAVEILAADLRRTLVQLGCPSWEALDRSWLWEGRDSPEIPG